jgi:MFS family permease
VRHALLDVIPLRTSPPFRRLCIGQALSRLGGQMTLVAVMFQVWQMTDSTAWTGAVGLAQAIPLVVLGLLAGSVVDRVDRRKFYLITTSGQAVFSLLLAAQGFLRTLDTSRPRECRCWSRFNPASSPAAARRHAPSSRVFYPSSNSQPDWL